MVGLRAGVFLLLGGACWAADLSGRRELAGGASQRRSILSKLHRSSDPSLDSVLDGFKGAEEVECHSVCGALGKAYSGMSMSTAGDSSTYRCDCGGEKVVVACRGHPFDRCCRDSCSDGKTLEQVLEGFQGESKVQCESVCEATGGIYEGMRMTRSGSSTQYTCTCSGQSVVVACKGQPFTECCKGSCDGGGGGAGGSGAVAAPKDLKEVLSGLKGQDKVECQSVCDSLGEDYHGFKMSRGSTSSAGSRVLTEYTCACGSQDVVVSCTGSPFDQCCRGRCPGVVAPRVRTLDEILTSLKGDTKVPCKCVCASQGEGYVGFRMDHEGKTQTTSTYYCGCTNNKEVVVSCKGLPFQQCCRDKCPA